MPITTLDVDDGDELDELDEGQAVYEALAAKVAELDAGQLFALVSHVQNGTPWNRLPLSLREVCADVEGEIVEVDEE